MRLLYIYLVLSSLTVSGILTGNAMAFSEQDLLIYYSNDVIGETEPCG